MMSGERGASVAEYLGVVAAVAVLLSGLVAVGEHRVRRQAPVDPVEVLVRAVSVPTPPRPPGARPAPVAGARPAPAPRRPRRAPPERPVVEGPRGAVGGGGGPRAVLVAEGGQDAGGAHEADGGAVLAGLQHGPGGATLGGGALADAAGVHEERAVEAAGEGAVGVAADDHIGADRGAEFA